MERERATESGCVDSSSSSDCSHVGVGQFSSHSGNLTHRLKIVSSYPTRVLCDDKMSQNL